MNSNKTKLFNILCFSRKSSWLKNHLFDEKIESFELANTVINSAFSKYSPLPTIRSAESMFPEDLLEEKRLIHQDKFGAYMVNWIDLMVDSDNPLREKVALFWHHHIPCGVGHKFEHAQLLLEIYREFGMGDLRTLLTKIAANPAMMYFLDGHWSHKDNPNENFSRELMELFTLGYGNYSDQDVKEASRAFTGRRFDHNNYPFNLYIDEDAVDYGQKTFMGKTGNWNGEDIIDILLEQKATAIHITKSAFKFFICDNPSEKDINNTADFYFNSGFEFKKLLEFIFSNKSLYEKFSQDKKVKTPVELFVSFRRLTGLKTVGIKSTLNYLRYCGQSLFQPPSVAGWPSGENMLKGQHLLYRLFLQSFFLKVANRSSSRDSFAYKVSSRVDNPEIRSFKFYSDAIFNEEEFIAILSENKISLGEWILGVKSELNLEEAVSHPLFQYY